MPQSAAFSLGNSILSSHRDGGTSFPIFVFSTALIGDLFIAIFAIMVATLPIAMLFSLLLDGLVIVWMLVMSGMGGVKDMQKKQAVMKRYIRRIVLTSIASFVPVIDMFPWHAYAIYGTWKDLNKK